MSIRVIAQIDPFNTKQTTQEYTSADVRTVRGICKDFGIDIKKANMRVMFDDTLITNYRKKPKEGQLVTIKLIPTGDNEMRAGGIGMAILGVVLCFIPGAQAVGVLMVAGGVGLFFGPEIIEAAYGDSSVSSPTAPRKGESSYMRGGGKKMGHNKNVPVILGENRHYPYHVAWPYASYSPTDLGTRNSISYSLVHGQQEQMKWRPTYVAVAEEREPVKQQVFLVGHKNVTPKNETYKLGDRLLRIPDPLGTDGKQLRDEDDNLVYADQPLGYVHVSEDVDANYGTKGKYHLSVNKKLKAVSIEEGVRTWHTEHVLLPTGTTHANIVFVLGYFYMIDGKNVVRRPRTSVKIQWREVGSITPMEPNAGNGSGRMNLGIKGGAVGGVDSVNQTIVSYDIPQVFDANKKYEVFVTRANDSYKGYYDGYHVTISNRFGGNSIGDAQSPLVVNSSWRGESLYFGEPDENTSNSFSSSTEIMLGHIVCTQNKPVMSAEAKGLYTTLAVTQTRNSKEVTVPEEFNYITQTAMLVWDKDVQSWRKDQYSVNPAAMFIYVLQGDANKRGVPDNMIDWETMKEWSEFCEDNGYECNLIIDNDMRIDELLKLIAVTGRASINHEERYSVIIDRPREYPTAVITDKNSFDMSVSRDFTEATHGTYISYINKDRDYKTDKIAVYAPGYGKSATSTQKKATLMETHEFVGVTNTAQAYSLAYFALKCRIRRRVTITVSVDWEQLLCQKGQLVRVAYDELAIGLGTGRVTQVIMSSSTDTTGLLLDEEMTFSPGKVYSITVRNNVADVARSTIRLRNPADDAGADVHTKAIYFNTRSTTVFNVDDLVMFGLNDAKAGLFLVTGITKNADQGAQLSLINYAEEVYESGPLPTYESLVTEPGSYDTSIALTTVYDPDTMFQDTQAELDKLKQLVGSSLSRSVNARIPDASLVTTNVLDVGISEDSLFYVDGDTLKLHQNTLLQVGKGTELPIGAVHSFDVSNDGKHIVYSSLDTDNQLKIYDMETKKSHTLVEYSSIHPKFSSGGIVVYADMEEGGLKQVTYAITEGVFTGGLITKVLHATTTDFDVCNGALAYRSQETGYIHQRAVSDPPKIQGKVINEADVTSVLVTPAEGGVETHGYRTLWWVDSVTGYSYKGGMEHYGNVSKHAVNTKQEYVFTNTEGSLYLATAYNRDYQLALNAQVERHSGTGIHGVLRAHDATIYHMSAEHIKQCAKGDTVTGLGIAPDNKISYVGHDYIIMDKTSLFDSHRAELVVVGTRLLLNANEVIVPGSITADRMQADAWNSTTRVNNVDSPNHQRPVYRIDHDKGEEWRYTKGGKCLYSFTEEDGLWLSEGIKIGGSSVADATEVPSKPKFTDTNGINFVQDTYPTTAKQGDTWFCTSNVSSPNNAKSFLDNHLYTKEHEGPTDYDWRIISNYSVPSVTIRAATPPVNKPVGTLWYNTAVNDATNTSGHEAKTLYVLFGTPADWQEVTPKGLEELDKVLFDKLKGIDYGATNTPPLITSSSIPTGTMRAKQEWYCTGNVSDTANNLEYYANTLYVYNNGTSTWLTTRPNHFEQPSEPKDVLVSERDTWACTETKAPYVKGTLYQRGATDWYVVSDSTKVFFEESPDNIQRGTNFDVDPSGKLTATSADISGKITATSGEFTGKITATSGEFLGTLKVGTGTEGGDPQFYIAAGGVIVAKGAVISGSIHATSATFGPSVKISAETTGTHSGTSTGSHTGPSSGTHSGESTGTQSGPVTGDVTSKVQAAAGSNFVTTDTSNRVVEVGDVGVRVKDSKGTIVHDIATQDVIANQYYMGHLMYMGGPSATSIFQGRPPWEWTTIQANNFGNDNARGGLFTAVLRIAHRGSWSLFVRPSGQASWGGEGGQVLYPAPGGRGHSLASGEAGTTMEFSCPFGAGDKVDIIIRTGVASGKLCNLDLRQVGVYV